MSRETSEALPGRRSVRWRPCEEPPGGGVPRAERCPSPALPQWVRGQLPPGPDQAHVASQSLASPACTLPFLPVRDEAPWSRVAGTVGQSKGVVSQLGPGQGVCRPPTPRSADWEAAAQPGCESLGHWPEWELLERVLGSLHRDTDIAGGGRGLDGSPGVTEGKSALEGAPAGAQHCPPWWWGQWEPASPQCRH